LRKFHSERSRARMPPILLAAAGDTIAGFFETEPRGSQRGNPVEHASRRSTILIAESGRPYLSFFRCTISCRLSIAGSDCSHSHDWDQRENISLGGEHESTRFGIGCRDRSPLGRIIERIGDTGQRRGNCACRTADRLRDHRQAKMPAWPSARLSRLLQAFGARLLT
jgi:hypothetical protein